MEAIFVKQFVSTRIICFIISTTVLILDMIYQMNWYFPLSILIYKYWNWYFLYLLLYFDVEVCCNFFGVLKGLKNYKPISCTQGSKVTNEIFRQCCSIFRKTSYIVWQASIYMEQIYSFHKNKDPVLAKCYREPKVHSICYLKHFSKFKHDQYKWSYPITGTIYSNFINDIHDGIEFEKRHRGSNLYWMSWCFLKLPEKTNKTKWFATKAMNIDTYRTFIITRKH